MPEAKAILSAAESAIIEAAKLQQAAKKEKEAAAELFAEAEAADPAKIRADAYQETQRVRAALEKLLREKDMELQKWRALARGKTPPKAPDLLELEEKRALEIRYWKSESQARGDRIKELERLLTAEKEDHEAVKARMADIQSINGQLEQDAVELNLTLDHLEEENLRLGERIREVNVNAHQTMAEAAPLAAGAPQSFWTWLRKAKSSASSMAEMGRVFVHGNSPFTEGQMDKIFTEAGCDRSPDGRSARIVVVGVEGFSTAYLDGLIRGKDTPKIWTQELALAALATGDDPLVTCPLTVLRELGKVHPAITYLMQLGFEWPVLPAEQESDVLIIGSFSAEQSPLTIMGYHVGEEYPRGLARRSRLAKIYSNRLAFSADYPADRKREWGSPCTPQRLKEIALQICRNIGRNQGRKGLRLACLHWEQDLAWLKSKFYTGKADFVWPG
ncbi:hypothetical protein WJU23_10835 [Prosthecobacter sp. SYSU 5D2]|uniref:hypothetical protein n=1 Tax=Prosthecobacter sp. SYSU 5D2 TaxID=3134134 RepID=UPI0031FE5F20